jgi:predicted RNase H-like HicB family nuclease
MTKQLQIDAPKYATVVRREDATDGTHCYVAFHPEFPNTTSQGDTPEEAEENLVEATELTLAHLKANNLPIPKPMSWQASIDFFRNIFLCAAE